MPLCRTRLTIQSHPTRAMRMLAIAALCLIPSALAQNPHANEAVAHRRAKAFIRGRATSNSQGAAALAAARTQHLALAAQAQLTSLTTAWTPVGPLQVQTSTYGLITGRITAAAIDPNDATGNTVYLGTSGGGVWKSTDAAGAASSVQFKPLTDTLPVFSPSAGTSVIASLSIGAVTVQPGGTGVILAGTGDPNDAADSYYGAGLLRSTDNGATWSLTQYATNGGVFSFAGEGFAGFAWSTASPQLVVAAVSSSAESTTVGDDKYPAVRGLYYSTDSGATWNLATVEDGSAILQGPNTSFANFRGNAATAVVFNPIRKRFYAAVRYHGYYESTDGITWTRLTAQPGAGLTTTNCPTRPGDYGTQSCPIFRGALAAQPTSGDLFALTVDMDNADGGLYQDTCNLTSAACASSTVTWSTKLNATPMETSGTIPQGDYNLALAAVPAATSLSLTDTLLFAGAGDLYRCSLAGGCTLRNTTNATDGCAAPAGVAPAQHAIAWQANLSNASSPLLYFGNDGGLWRSTDGVKQTGSACSAGDATHFDNLNSALGSLAEVSSLSSHPSNANVLLAALGANGSAASTTSAQATNQSPWTQLSSGESGTVAIDQGNGSIWLAQSGGGIALHTCTSGTSCTAADFAGPAAVGLTQTSADTSLTDPPALLDPVLNSNLITGTCRVWRGPTTGGSAWSISNAISPFLAGPAASACNGADAAIRSLAAGGSVQITNATQTSGSPILYAGLSGTANGGSTWGGRIFGTTGANIATSTTPWTDLTNTVTNDPSGFNPGGFDVSSIAVDPNDPTGRTVYATVLGFGYPHLYRSTNAGATWTNISANLPNAPANAVAVDPGNAGVVYVAMDTGVYVTTDVTSCISASGSTVNCWSVMGAALPNAPVLALTASKGAGAGVLRAGTYGRGIWQQPLLSAGTVSLPVATFSPSSITFATSQQVGTSSPTQTVTLTNTGNTGMVIASVSVPAGFIETDTCAGTTLPVSTSCNLTVTFVPLADGPVTGSLQVVANVSGGYAALPLSGTGIGIPHITYSPASLTFGSTPAGGVSATQTVTATNDGTAPASLSWPWIFQGDYQIPSTTCQGITLAIHQSCTINVAFAPLTTAAAGGTLELIGSGTWYSLPLNGIATGTSNVSVSPTSLSYVHQPVGTNSSWQIVTVSNSGTAAANLSTPVFTGNDWVVGMSTCGIFLQPAANCQYAITFRPSQIGTRTGTFTVIADGMSYPVPLSGYGFDFPALSMSPSTLTFPTTAIGAVSAMQNVTFTSATENPVDTSQGLVQVSGDFGVAVNNCNSTTTQLAPGASCTLSVVFSPTDAGTRSGQLTYTVLGQSNTVILSGTGQGTTVVGLNPSTLAFPITSVFTTSAAQSITVTNTGNATSSLATPVLTGDFRLTANTCGATLAASATCTLTVTFTPILDGLRTGSVSITSTDGTHTTALTGTGQGTSNILVSPLTLSFASSALHTTSAAQTITVTNSGTAAASLGAPTLTGDFALSADTCVSTIAAGATCTLSVTFTPTATGPRSGSLSFIQGSVTHTVALSGGGSAGQLVPSATTLTFNDTAPGATSNAQTLTVTNTGTGTLNIGGIAITGDFAITTGTCSNTALAPGKTCSVSMAFTPTAVGAGTGTLTLTSDSGGTSGTATSIALNGNGIGPFNIVLTPTSANFGTQNVGTTSAVTNITISNTGKSSGALTSITVSGDFVLTANTCGTSLASQVGCTVSVVFKPTATGVRNGQLTVAGDAGTQTASFTGTGTLAATDMLSPLSLTFAAQQVGATGASQSVTLTNSGDNPLTLVASQILTGDFTAVNACGPTLTAHTSCAITVAFAPKSVGTLTGTLQVSDVLHVQTVALTGTATAGPGVSLSPAALTFAATGVGVAGAGQGLTLTNNGGVPLQISAVNVTGDFGIVAGTSTCSSTTTIAAGSACTMQVAFVPTTSGLRSGAITVLSNAATQTTQLSGTGIDFSLNPNGPTSLTIASGSNAVYPLLLRPAINTSDKVTYTCTGAPAYARCTVVSQYSDLSATGTVTVTLLTGTTAQIRIAAAAALPILLGLPWIIRRRSTRGAALALCGLAMLICSAGCGSGRKSAGSGTGNSPTGGGSTPTPTGTYNITVTATAAGVTHAQQLTLIVQ